MKKKTEEPKEIPVVLDKTPAWRRTNDLQGHEPAFKIHCWRCKSIAGERIKEIQYQIENGADKDEKLKLLEEWFKLETMPMALRHSIVTVDEENHDRPIEINQMSYKCPRCAWFVRFYVIDDVEYLKQVFEWRDKKQKFIPSVDNWSEEHAEIGRQLQAMGYWAGR